LKRNAKNGNLDMKRFAPLTRRTTLAGLTALTIAGNAPGQTGPVRGPFLHGIASGDPDATSVVLWTRITTPSDVEVECEVATDAAFQNIVWRARQMASADRDFTTKFVASRLKPGTRYHYRFRTGDVVSRTGQTRTLPLGRVERLGIALASCSNFAFGYFNAYDAIAKDTAVDFVLHTGDYIYEYAAGGWGGDVARKIGRVHEPANEIVSLSDYRTRHAQYKTDAGSQDMLAAKPLLACWDDHESANNPWVGGAQNHQPATEGDWASRRAASIQAYYEWMPVREPVLGRTRMQFWRHYSFGDIATLSTLETRHTARAQQVDYTPFYTSLASKADAEAMERNLIGAPDRRLISAQQETDLAAAWANSKQLAQPWRLIGNPMPIARTRVPDVVALGVISNPETQAKPLDAARELAW
jgi:alkaline phosphatase D